MAVKIRTDIDWQDVRFFSALARLGTLSAAARSLRVTHVTVARRIARLEAGVGARLFDRRAEGYRLTADGSAILETVQKMEDAAAALTRTKADPPLAGLVRLTATASLIDIFLLPALAPFLAANPGLDLEVVADRRPLSLARYETDVALRMGPPDDGDVVARRLAEIGYGAYADDDWAARLAAGEAAQFVGFDEQNASLVEAVWLARTFPKARVRVRAGTHFSQAEACATGAGVAILPRYVAGRLPALSPVDIGQAPPARTLWLLTRQDVRTAPAIRAVALFLTQAFEQRAAMFTDAR